MSFNKYFHDELSAIRDLGREFSRQNPRLAPFLAAEAQDPDVERLLEGFAFLTGRVRQKLDDELPELTHALMSMLWPGFLRPLPAFSILQMQPSSKVKSKQCVPRGVDVKSTPVDGTACRFRTCYDVDLYPLALESAESHSGAGASTLRLTLSLTANTSFDEIGLSCLRLFLGGETYIARGLYLWLSRYCAGIKVKALDASGESHFLANLLPDSIKPVGFEGAEALLPGTGQTFTGFALIQEYFALPEKFQFVDVTGLEKIYQSDAHRAFLRQATALALEFQFIRPFDVHVQINKDHLKLYCTPVVNIFEHTAIPIKLDHKKTAYRVIAEGQSPRHYDVFAIEKVQGWHPSSRQYREYHRFESFNHVGIVDANSQPIFYREKLTPNPVDNSVDHYLSFVDDNAQDSQVDAEIVSINLLCTNRNLPVELGLGDINLCDEGCPEYVTVSNITQVTPSCSPPLDQGHYWQLISNMSLNYLSLANVDALRLILSAYDYRRFHDRQQARASQQRLDGLISVASEPVDALFKGSVIRGLRTTLGLRESHFASEGDMFLFASVLNECFALYAGINTFHEMVVTGVEHGEVYRWRPRLGQQPLL